MLISFLSLVLLVPSLGAAQEEAPIDRKKIVQSFNPSRTASSETTPLQVGNGNFAFGADVTGLQTFKPFGILSTWGWHNFSLPTTENQTSIDGMYNMPPGLIGMCIRSEAMSNWVYN